MEIPINNQKGEGTENAEITPSQPTADLAPLSIIRTEATLSRFPIHTLDKKGNVNIRIVKKTAKGEIDVKWIVSHNSQAGRPGQLAYKLDTIIINRRIDETREQQKFLPELIRLGSLYEISKELGLGRDTNSVRKALLQNSGANIDAKIRYTTTDGVEREVTFNDTRYGILFTGEKFPDGRKADAVYISLHSFFREVLNNSPVRPLDYDYLKQLPPSAQRFYEIVSRKMFAALKYGHAKAKLSYSEFCTFSAQQRQLDYDHFKKQMYKIHRPHITSGYILKVQYEIATDEEGNSDWLMLYTPGPKAKAEFDAFNGGSRTPRIRRTKKLLTTDSSVENRSEPDEVTVRDEQSNDDGNKPDERGLVSVATPVQLKPDEVLPTTAARETVDPEILTALTSRGIFETTVRKLLTAIPTDRLELVADYVDYWDSIPPAKKTPGLLHALIKDGDPLPSSFETRRKREERLTAEDRRRKLTVIKDTLSARYSEYRQGVVERYISEELTAGEFDRRVEDRLKNDKQAALDGVWKQSPEMRAQFARHDVRAQIMQEMNFLPYEDFRDRELPRIFAELQLQPTELGIELTRHPTEVTKHTTGGDADRPDTLQGQDSSL